jgi:nucleotide-binding universal stress UspA family protein
MFNILLPTDFSDNAQRAIDYTVYLLENEACTFYLLNAYYIAPSAPGTISDSGHNLGELQRKLEATKNLQHTFERVLITDTALSAIEKTITDNEIHYVFMGTKGFSAVREIFIGSVTVSVIKHI